MSKRGGISFVCALLAACGADLVLEPVETVLEVRYSSPHKDDAAIVLEVNGPHLLSVELVDSTSVMFSGPIDDRTTRVIVVGAVPPGPLLHVVVRGESNGSEYDAVVVQVADTSNALRVDLSKHRFEISVLHRIRQTR